MKYLPEYNGPPLRVIVIGPPGTGKTVVVNAALRHVNSWGLSHAVRCGSYTGKAAQLIRKKGRTLSSLNNKKEAKVEFESAKCFLVDELSMTSLDMLDKLRETVEVGKSRPSGADGFSGMHMALIGDPCQFQCIDGLPLHKFALLVGRPDAPALLKKIMNSKALEKSRTPATRRKRAEAIVRSLTLLQTFKDVVILDEQKRVQDAEWNEMLGRMRFCYHHTHVPKDQRDYWIKRDYALLESCLIKNASKEKCNSLRDAPMIATRNATRMVVGNMRMVDYAKRNGKPIIRYTNTADDMILRKGESSKPATSIHKILAQLLLELPDKYCNGRPKRFTYCEGYRSVLNDNGAVELGHVSTVSSVQSHDSEGSRQFPRRPFTFTQANGVTGTTVSIALDDREPPHKGGLYWDLEYAPAYILFRPDDPFHESLAGLPDGIFMVFPEKTTFAYNVPTAMRRFVQGRKTLSVIRGPCFAISQAMVGSDYTWQGSTAYKGAHLDLAQPRDGVPLKLPNVYVMCSRVPGRAFCLILRLFPIEVLKNLRIDKDLLHFLNRLEELQATTLKRHTVA